MVYWCYNVLKRTLRCELQRKEELEENDRPTALTIPLGPDFELSGRCQTGAATEQATQCECAGATKPPPRAKQALQCSKSAHAPKTPLLREADPCSAVKGARKCPEAPSFAGV